MTKHADWHFGRVCISEVCDDFMDLTTDEHSGHNIKAITVIIVIIYTCTKIVFQNFIIQI